MSKSAKGAAAKLILDATGLPGVFVYTRGLPSFIIAWKVNLPYVWSSCHEASSTTAITVSYNSSHIEHTMITSVR